MAGVLTLISLSKKMCSRSFQVGNLYPSYAFAISLAYILTASCLRLFPLTVIGIALSTGSPITTSSLCISACFGALALARAMYGQIDSTYPSLSEVQDESARPGSQLQEGLVPV